MRNQVVQSQSFIAMQAALTADLGQFHGQMVHTAISGTRSGSFLGRELAPLGTFGHVVLQVLPDGRPMLRVYVAGPGRGPDELVIGTPAFNVAAYDLTGTGDRLFPSENAALAATVTRMLADLPNGVNVDPERGLQLPAFFVQFQPEDMRLPEPGRALFELMTDIRKGLVDPASLLAPCDGEIVNWTQDQYAPDFGWAGIVDADGVRHDVLLPTQANFITAVGDQVLKGQSLCLLRGGKVRQDVLELVAWGEAKQSLPGQKGEFLPLLFALPLLRAGKIPTLVLEDMRPLLGFSAIENPVADIRKLSDFHLPASELGDRQARVLSAARRELGTLSIFASDRDILRALDANSDMPMVLSGMVANQVWTASKPAEMRFRAPGMYVDLAALRRRWVRELGPVDAVVKLAPEKEAALLDVALTVARQSHTPGVAEAVLYQLPEAAGMVGLLGRFGADGSAEKYLEERRDAVLEEAAHH